MNTKLVIGGIGILAAGALAYTLMNGESGRQTPDSGTPATEVRSTETYYNETFGYQFEYPKEYDLYEYTPSIVAVGTKEGEGMVGAVEIQVFESDADAAESYDEYIVTRMQNLCAADGPTASIGCTEVERATPVTTSTGLSGTQYYLREVTTNLSTGENTEKSKGPFYAFNITANSAATHAALVIYPPVVLSAEEISKPLLEGIIDTLSVARVEREAGSAPEPAAN